MAYKKPMCDCGEELVFQVDEVMEVEYRIKKDGTLSKRGVQKGSSINANWGRLYCRNCENSYECNYDFTGKEAFKFKREELLD